MRHTTIIVTTAIVTVTIIKVRLVTVVVDLNVVVVPVVNASYKESHTIRPKIVATIHLISYLMNSHQS